MGKWILENLGSIVGIIISLASVYFTWKANIRADEANAIALQATEDAKRSMYSAFDNYLNRIESKFISYSENFYEYSIGNNYRKIRELNEFILGIIKGEDVIVYPNGYEKVFDEIIEHSIPISQTVLSAYNITMAKQDIEKANSYMDESKQEIDELISYIRKIKKDLEQP